MLTATAFPRWLNQLSLTHPGLCILSHFPSWCFVGKTVGADMRASTFIFQTSKVFLLPFAEEGGLTIPPHPPSFYLVFPWLLTPFISSYFSLTQGKVVDIHWRYTYFLFYTLRSGFLALSLLEKYFETSNNHIIALFFISHLGKGKSNSLGIIGIMEALDTVSSPAHDCHLMSVATISGSGVSSFSFILGAFVSS